MDGAEERGPVRRELHEPSATLLDVLDDEPGHPVAENHLAPGLSADRA